jgi:hypothetical protein
MEELFKPSIFRPWRVPKDKHVASVDILLCKQVIEQHSGSQSSTRVRRGQRLRQPRERAPRAIIAPMSAPRRFPPPWSIEERQESFIVKDANGQQLAYLYFEDEPQRQMSMKRLSRDEAFLIAVNIAKLPSVPRQILKDIPRPPNSASRDD